MGEPKFIDAPGPQNAPKFIDAPGPDQAGPQFIDAPRPDVSVRRPQVQSTLEGNQAAAFRQKEGGRNLLDALKKAAQPGIDYAQALEAERKAAVKEGVSGVLKMGGRTAKGAAMAIPQFGQKVVELPLDLYALIDPESGAEAIRNTRKFYGWDTDAFQPTTPSEQLGNVPANIGIQALEAAATGGVGSAAPRAIQAPLAALLMGGQGALSKAGQISQTQQPGERAEDFAKRMRYGAAAQGLLDTATFFSTQIERYRCS